MISSSEEHVHDNAAGEDVDGLEYLKRESYLRIVFIKYNFWSHEDQCATMLVKSLKCRIAVLGREAKISKFN